MLCDGAPNVGSSFGKDAFVQNDLALAAVRFATDHLKRGGWFVTKVFRSADYNALMFVFNQLFRKVEATKPISSRNVSAEIFVVCRDYLAPDKIDPRMLDSKYVFQQVDPRQDNGAKMPLSTLLGEDKKNTQKKFRVGYDDNASMSMFRSHRAVDFIRSEDPVRVLTESNVLTFDTDDEDAGLVLNHRATTSEIKLLCADLKVVGKNDFKQLVKWRLALLKDLPKQIQEGDDEDDPLNEARKRQRTDSNAQEGQDDENDVKLSKTLMSIEAHQKKEDKKIRREKSKLQNRKDQGMIHPYAIDVSEQEAPFSLRSIGATSSKDPRLDAFRDVDNETRVEDDSTYGQQEQAEDDGDDEEDDGEPKSYSDIIEKQLEFDYERFARKRELREPMSVQERRRQRTAEHLAKKKKSALDRMTDEDFQNAIEDAKRDAYEKGVYAKMLRKGISGDSDDEDEDDEENQVENGNDDDNDDDDEDDSDHAQSAAKQWYQQPLFKNPILDEDEDDEDEDDDQEHNVRYESDEEEAEDFSDMPLPSEMLDKSKRREKRKKVEDRKERKKVRKEKESARSGGEMKAKPLEMVQADYSMHRADDDEDEVYNSDDSQAIAERREADGKHRKMIEQGMGNALKKSGGKDGNQEIQVVRRGDPDDAMGVGAVYDSDDYDSDEHATHLALGSMLTKKSMRDDILDSAFNRFAFNDGPLPAWFAEDESRHNRPNLPVTKEMIASVKARFSDMNDRPIKKIAEARMRKRKRALKKLDEVKKKATSVADEPDISARSKMRTIEKLYRGAEIKRAGAVYSVSTKAGSKMAGGKGAGSKKAPKGSRVKVVDKRLKKDSRGLKRAEKKNGGGRKRR